MATKTETKTEKPAEDTGKQPETETKPPALAGETGTDLAMSNEDAERELAEMSQGGSPALRIMLNEKLFDRARVMAGYLSKAQGFVPPHLIGKPESCFAVITRALTWRLDPYAVAQSTYQTPNGNVGYEGKLCQAILENSGKLVGPVTYEHYGDWSKVMGKFEKKTSQKGRDYLAPTWTDKDAAGLGVIVRAQVRGEEKPREWRMDLIQCHPRNSTLWATDPRTQICYTAVRRFGSVAAPGLFMGVPFDRDDMDPATTARDITPERPKRSDYDPAAAGHADPEAQYRQHMNGTVYDAETGEIIEEADGATEGEDNTGTEATDDGDAAEERTFDWKLEGLPANAGKATASRWANDASAVIGGIADTDELAAFDTAYQGSMENLKKAFDDKFEWLRSCIKVRHDELQEAEAAA